MVDRAALRLAIAARKACDWEAHTFAVAMLVEERRRTRIGAAVRRIRRSPKELRDALAASVQGGEEWAVLEAERWGAAVGGVGRR